MGRDGAGGTANGSIAGGGAVEAGLPFPDFADPIECR